jgi:predicted ATPase
MVTRNNFHIFTGGPGAGKTTVLEALRMRGYACVEETGRKIIREQAAIGGNIHHNGDRIAYRDLMLSRAIADYERMAAQSGPVFFDRGIPDLVGYNRLIGTEIPQAMRDAAEAYRYNPDVFVFPPWREIYANDTERKQDFAEAIESWQAAVDILPVFGYRVIEVPRASREARVQFVIGPQGAA